MNQELFPNQKTVYGPVKSWRFGQSLGIDPIFQTSTCSFNCIYCQLGDIQKVTTERKIFVETKKVLADFQEILDSKVAIDIITFSGSGEPTLALNIGEMAKEIKKMAPHIPLNILTNATHLHLSEVREDLNSFDRVSVKLDAADETNFQRINRPAPGVTLESIINGILELKKSFKKEIEMQMMFMPINSKQVDQLAVLIEKIKPDFVQLNTPTRPYPLSWHRENRGNHLKIFNYDVRELQTISMEQATQIESTLRSKTGVPIYSVYRT